MKILEPFGTIYISSERPLEPQFEKYNQMLSDKVDCAQFLTWFIENYPQSAEETWKADAEFWTQFK